MTDTNFVQEGLRALRDGEHTLALALFEQAHLAAPDAVEPRYLFAVALTKLGRYTQALDTARQSLATHIGYAPLLELLEHLEASLEKIPSQQHIPSTATHWQIGELIEDRWVVFGGAEGGMGRVYFVRDTLWDNAALAVKTMRSASFSQRERFLQEAQVWLDLGAHPYVVSGYYTLEIGGAPRFFMEYIPGLSLDFTLARGLLPLEQAQDVAIQIASGMEFVHARGVVHRDLKPQNCLLTRDGTIKLIDFGLGKAIEAEELPILESNKVLGPFSTKLSQHGVGTAAYMPPEQWSGLRLAQKPADVYSFGVMLYELLVGASPFASQFYPRYAETAPLQLRRLLAAEHPSPELREVRDELCHRYLNPLSPMELGASCSDELSRLALQCLQKKPSLRPSFTEVRAALLVEVGAKYHRALPAPLEPTESGENNRAISYYAMEKRQRSKEILDSWLEANPRALYPWFNRHLIALYEQEADEAQVAEELATQIIPAHSAEIEADHVCAQAKHRLFKNIWPRARAKHPASIAIKEGSATIFLAVDDQIEVYQYETGERQAKIPSHQGDIVSMALASDGGALLTLGADRTARLWDVSTQAPSRIFLIGNTTSFAALHSHYTIFLGQELQLWDTQRGKRIREQRLDGETAACISSDGKLALTSGKVARLYQLPSLKILRTFRGSGRTAAMSLDGTLVATVGDDGSASLFEASSGRLLHTLPALPSAGSALAFSKNKELLAIGCEDGAIALWSIAEEKMLRWIESGERSRGAIASIGFITPHRMYTLSSAKELRFWERDFARWPLLLQRARSPEEQLNLEKRKEALLQRLLAREKSALFEVRLLQKTAPELARDDELLSAIHRLGVDGGSFAGLHDVFLAVSIAAKRVRGGCFDADSVWLATGSGAQQFSLRGEFLSLLGAEAFSAIAISRQKNIVATGTRSGLIYLWDLKSRTQINVLEGHAMGITSLAFSSDGELLCSCSDENHARLWDVSTGTHRLLLARRDILASCVSAQNAPLWAGTGTHGDLHLWEERGEDRAHLKGRDTFSRSIALSPDGALCLIGGNQGAFTRDLTTNRAKPLSHYGKISAVAIGMSGALLCTAGKDCSLKFWSPSGALLREQEGVSSAARTATFSDDGALLLLTTEDDHAQLWRIDAQWSL